MAATASVWAKPGAWALDAEENETELLKQRTEDAAVNNGHSKVAETADFPSLSAAASTKAKKKKKQTVSLQEFTTYGGPKPTAYQPKTQATVDVSSLPTGPRERTAEELDRSRLGGGFKSYGSRDEQPRRQGGFNSDREFTPSKADEVDDWGKGKKSPVGGGGGFERRERGERGGFFTDSQSRADEVDNWASKKSFVPSEPRRNERKMGFGLESGNGGADADNWARKKEGSAFDSLRDRRGGSDVDSESWGRRREEPSVVGGGGGGGGGRPKLNLQPRTLPVPVIEVQPKVVEVQPKEVEVAAPVVNKPKASNPFGQARPREEVLKEKGQDWKEIEEKLESVKVKETKETAWADATKNGFWGSSNGRDRPRVAEEKTENAWRKPGPIVSRPESAGGSENGSAVNTENGNGHTKEAGEGETQI